jgi:iron complex outermembrane receptor protein
VGMGSLTYMPIKNMSLNILGKYVGKQYYDNTSNDENSLDAYFVSNFVAGYTFRMKNVGSIDLQFIINNLFDKDFIANALVSTDKFNDGTEKVYKGLFPQATRNFMGRVTVRF